MVLWELPEEVLVHILGYMSARELGAVLPLVCRLLRDLASDDALWKASTCPPLSFSSSIFLFPLLCHTPN
jgi:hypothetical protein